MSRIALYIRLSVEDAIKVDESESIINQRLYLQDYVKRNDEFNGLEVEEFIDDGYSGTHENRPSFQKMLNVYYLQHHQYLLFLYIFDIHKVYFLLDVSVRRRYGIIGCIPAVVNNTELSPCGTTDAEGISVCPFSLK